MIISRKHRIHTLAIEAMGHVLSHILIEQIGDGPSGIAVASNESVIAIVPVKIETGDRIPALVDSILFKEAFAVGTGATVRMMIHEKDVTLPGSRFKGIRYPRLQAGLPHGTKFPSWRNVVPIRPDAEIGHPYVFSFDALLLGRVVYALGVEPARYFNDLTPVHLTRSALDGPILVEICPPAEDTHEPVPPFGVLMPCVLVGSQDHYHEIPSIAGVVMGATGSVGTGDHA